MKRLLYFAITFGALALSSCSVRLNADGSKEATIDGEGIARILAEK